MRVEKNLLHVGVILLMKLLVKLIGYQFDTLTPSNYQPTVNGTCRLREAMPDVAPDETVTSWMFSCRAILHVFGGLLASVCLGYLLTIKICGYAVLVSTILLSIVVYRDLVCHPSNVLVIVTWLLGALQFGILQPSIIYALYSRHLDKPRVWSIITSGFFLAIKIGGAISLLLPMLRDAIGYSFTIICIALSISFIVLSSILPKRSNQKPFLMPTVARMILYSKVFTFMFLFSISIVDSRSIVYSTEIRHYVNITGQPDKGTFASAEMIRVASQILCSLGLMVAAYLHPKQLPTEPRIYAGIGIEALVSVSLTIIVSLVPPRSAMDVHAIYSVANVLDGVAEVLTVAAGYEVMLGVAARGSELLVYGMCFTIWGLAALVSRALIAFLSALPRDNPVLRPSPDRMTLFFVYHLVILAMMGVSVVHYRFVARPIINMLSLVGVDDYLDHTADSNEILPILERSTDSTNTSTLFRQ